MELCSDSVEFGPEGVLACGCYELKEDGTKTGSLHLFETSQGLDTRNAIETPAILDVEWLNDTTISIAHVSGVSIVTCDLEQDVQIDMDAIALSCEKQKGSQHSDRLIVGRSDGKVSLLQIGKGNITAIKEQKAHDFEVWAAAFDVNDENVFFSGADDCLFKGWDQRTDHALFSLSEHTMGVCSIAPAVASHSLATGSYDEQIRLWDTRKMTKPMYTVPTGGGVWRLRWSPWDPTLLAAACMHNGFHVFQIKDRPEHISENLSHESLAYGISWSSSDPNIVACCSFYDHTLSLWQRE